jgi:hypothetical protein
LGRWSFDTVKDRGQAATHIYATDGEYTIRTTVTDDDGSYWAESIASIGEYHAPLVPSDDPVIVSSVSEILPNGNALLTVKAVDCEGSSNLIYQWDMDGDDICEMTGGPTVEIPPGPHFYRYMTTVRTTDSKGRWTEGGYWFEKNETYSLPSKDRPAEAAATSEP